MNNADLVRLFELFTNEKPDGWHSCVILQAQNTEYRTQWFGDVWFYEPIHTHGEQIDEMIDWIDDHICAPHQLYCILSYRESNPDDGKILFGVAFKDVNHAMQFRLRWNTIDV